MYITTTTSMFLLQTTKVEAATDGPALERTYTEKHTYTCQRLAGQTQMQYSCQSQRMFPLQRLLRHQLLQCLLRHQLPPPLALAAQQKTPSIMGKIVMEHSSSRYTVTDAVANTSHPRRRFLVTAGFQQLPRHQLPRLQLTAPLASHAPLERFVARFHQGQALTVVYILVQKLDVPRIRTAQAHPAHKMQQLKNQEKPWPK
jgi:hypothetical protein